MILEKWFSVPIWYDVVENIDYKNAAKSCIKISKTYPNRQLSNVGGWQSQDIELSSYKQLMPIKSAINQKIREFSKDIHPNCNLRLDNCWLNINYTNNYNLRHVHPCSLFSGVIYISVDENSGKIIFDNNSHAEHYPTLKNIETDLFHKMVNYTPKNGLIVIFPAWLHHQVQPNSSSEPRISIAFNVQQV